LSRRTRIALLAAGLVATAFALAMILMRHRAAGPAPVRSELELGRVDDAAEARLREVPLYRNVLKRDALRGASIEGPTVVVALDLVETIRDRLTRAPVAGAAELLPATARGVVTFASEAPGAALTRETWRLDGPAPLLDVLDRRAGTLGGSAIWDAIPASPSALSAGRILPGRLADPSFGGAALAPWRDRAQLAERVLGRSLRAEIAEDLAGPVAFALYEAAGAREASAVVVIELKRSDRLRALLETVFALGALTERATVRRYRDVATGSFAAGNRGSGLAVAVDGPLLIAATSRFLLESAIDARRGDRRATGLVDELRGSRASWASVSQSLYVARVWHGLARAAPPASAALERSSLTPDGASSWRLDGEGPAPAVTADPVVPFVYRVLGARQRGAD
jgi:hypothetical protein